MMSWEVTEGFGRFAQAQISLKIACEGLSWLIRFVKWLEYAWLCLKRLTHDDELNVDLSFADSIDSTTSKDPRVIQFSGLNLQNLVVASRHVVQPGVINLLAILQKNMLTATKWKNFRMFRFDLCSWSCQEVCSKILKVCKKSRLNFYGEGGIYNYVGMMKQCICQKMTKKG